MASVTYFDVKGSGLTDDEIDANLRAVNWIDGGDLASAGTLANTAAANLYHITGTTTITGMTAFADDDGNYGRICRLVFDDALQLTHSAGFFLPNAGNNITTVLNDVATFVNDAVGVWRCTSYVRADGTALVGDTSGNAEIGGDLSVVGHAHFGTKTTVAITTGVATVDWTAGNKAFLSLTESLDDALDVLFTAPSGSANLTLNVSNTGTYTIDAAAWPATVLWPGGIAPVLGAGVGGQNELFTFYWDGANYFGAYLQDYS